MSNWTLLPLPEPKGILRALNSKIRAYHLPDDELAILGYDGHGFDLNPNQPTLYTDQRGMTYRGYYKTLLFVELDVHCAIKGDPSRFPFKFGHTDRLSGAELQHWIRESLIRLFTHEVDEALTDKDND